MQILPTSEANLAEWLNYLLAIHPKEIDMGLERVKSVAKKMNLFNLVTDFSSPTIITVAGTNGKGTTCVMLEAILSQAGKRVGVYSSPHIINFNERVRVCGIDASDEQLICAFQAIEKAREMVSLTFFEFATLAALYIFKSSNLDVIILEVGLGGRLDATNIMDADISVISAIGIDHQEYLGDTRELISYEKAGIFRSNGIAVIGEPDIPAPMFHYASQINASIYGVNLDNGFQYQRHENNWSYNGKIFNFNALPIPQLPLPNAATVLAIVEQLRNTLLVELSLSEIKRCIVCGLKQAKLAGRFEKISVKPDIYVDVAHNPHAATYLAQQLAIIKSQQGRGRIIALWAMLKDKDIAGVAKAICAVIDKWFIAGLPCDRGANVAYLESVLEQQKSIGHYAIHYQGYETITYAWNALQEEVTEDDVVIVFGSFYTVAEVNLLLSGE